MMLILATTPDQVETLLANARQIEQDARSKTFDEQMTAAKTVLALRKVARLSLEAMDFKGSIW